MPKANHIVFRNSSLFCGNCGNNEKLQMPISMDEIQKAISKFSTKHKKSKKTWIDPTIKPTPTPLKESEIWWNEVENQKRWLEHGEHGVSAKTMFKYLSDDIEIEINFPESHPHDPDDFRRCYLLLETVPQFKTKLWRLENLSPVFENLVKNWDKLSRMLEEQMRTKKDNGMYDFMKGLGC